jgi:hypothetical protein
VREIAEIARRQYKAWRSLAEEWETYPDLPTGQERCMTCNMGIVNLVDTQGENRQYTNEEILTLTVAHLRNYHRDLEAVVYKAAGI